MFKVRCNKNWDSDVWHLDVGKIYDCDVRDDIYIIKESQVIGNNSSILNITYSKQDFYKRFTDIQEERKLKLNNIKKISDEKHEGSKTK